MSNPTPINGTHDHGTEQEARLSARLSALGRLCEAAEGRLPDGLPAAGRQVLRRAEQRLRVAPSHTAVAMTGPPGSGTSSLFNAVVGLRLSEERPRRFATPPGPMACVWDEAGAAPLLDALGIPQNRRAVRHGPLDTSVSDMPSGLVLIDVPGDDPSFAWNADHVVWIVDATSAVTLEPPVELVRAATRPYGTVTLVVNKTDEAPWALIPHDLPMLRVSARTGEGVAALREAVAHAVRGGALRRLSADVDAVTERFDPYFAGRVPQPGDDDAARAALVEEVARGVDLEAAASGAAQRPRRLPDDDARAAVRRAVDTLTDGMPEVWSAAVRHAVGKTASRLPDALEAELAAAAPDDKRPAHVFRRAARRYEAEYVRALRGKAEAVVDDLVLKPAGEETGRYREAHALYVASREPLYRSDNPPPE